MYPATSESVSVSDQDLFRSVSTTTLPFTLDLVIVTFAARITSPSGQSIVLESMTAPAAVMVHEPE